MSLPCNLNNKTDCHTGVLVCSAECVYNKQSFVGKFFQSDLFYRIPGFLAGRMVIILIFIRCPPYGVLGILVHDNELVLR